MRYQRRDSFPIVLTSPISDKATTTIAENRDITTIPLHRCFLHQVQTPIQQARPNPNLVDPSQQLPALSQAHTKLPNYQSSFLLATTPHNPPSRRSNILDPDTRIKLIFTNSEPPAPFLHPHSPFPFSPERFCRYRILVARMYESSEVGIHKSVDDV